MLINDMQYELLTVSLQRTSFLPLYSKVPSLM